MLRKLEMWISSPQSSLQVFSGSKGPMVAEIWSPRHWKKYQTEFHPTVCDLPHSTISQVVQLESTLRRRRIHARLANVLATRYRARWSDGSRRKRPVSQGRAS